MTIEPDAADTHVLEEVDRWRGIPSCGDQV